MGAGERGAAVVCGMHDWRAPSLLIGNRRVGVGPIEMTEDTSIPNLCCLSSAPDIGKVADGMERGASDR